MNARSCTSICATYVFEALRKRLKASESGVEEANRASRRGSAFDVVIRGGELNQPLEKLLTIAFGREPELFPRLMRVPEVVGVELGHTLFDGVQSSARVPFLSTSQIATVKSVVEPVPPMSRVRCSSPIASTFTIAS